MTREELFKKYDVQERHEQWNEHVDNHLSIEIFRLIYNRFPQENDNAVIWVTKFLDNTTDENYMSELKKRNDWGMLLLTAKRMIYKYAEDILEELK